MSEQTTQPPQEMMIDQLLRHLRQVRAMVGIIGQGDNDADEKTLSDIHELMFLAENKLDHAMDLLHTYDDLRTYVPEKW
jgi:hypothetical protein